MISIPSDASMIFCSPKSVVDIVTCKEFEPSSEYLVFQTGLIGALYNVPVIMHQAIAPNKLIVIKGTKFLTEISIESE